MAQPERKDDFSTITSLKWHDLLHIFDYLDYEELLQCRLVCSSWYQIIKHESRLLDRFRFGLTLDSGSVISPDEPPFSIIEESKIKLKRITIKEDFLDLGYSIATVEANRLKLLELSGMLAKLETTQTVTEMVVYAKDNESRTNALLFQLIREMRSLRSLRFTLTAFVHSLDTICSAPESIEQCESLEHIQIMHTDCKRLVLADFTHLKRIFPNIARVDVIPSDAMLLGEDIIQSLAGFIKSIEKLEAYTLTELAGIPRMSLRHISYECCADNVQDVMGLHDFLIEHPEIETMGLKLLNGTGKFFNQPLQSLVDLDLNIKTIRATDEMEESLKLGNILLGAPNLRKLSVSVKYKGKHEFGHRVVELEDLIDVTMTRFCLDCETCFITLLKSIANVVTLKFAHRSAITIRQLSLISTHLKQLQSLELMFDDSVELENEFDRWPALPKLKSLVVNRVGYLTNKKIANLQKKCPLLEVIKFYSLRGANMAGLLKLTVKSFPNLVVITFRGGRCHNIPELDYISSNVGWRLKEIDVSACIHPPAIAKLFKDNNFLETVRCKYGALEVTRRIYYEIVVLNAYTFESIQQPLKSRKRLHMYDDMSSDSETSNSEESSSESEYDEGDDEEEEEN